MQRWTWGAKDREPASLLRSTACAEPEKALNLKGTQLERALKKPQETARSRKKPQNEEGPPIGRPSDQSGVDEDRTHNLLDATEALSQLSYHPMGGWKV